MIIKINSMWAFLCTFTPKYAYIMYKEIKTAESYHVPVLLDESVGGLNIKKGGIYVDVTFGGGGHSREILSRLDPRQDYSASTRTRTPKAISASRTTDSRSSEATSDTSRTG